MSLTSEDSRSHWRTPRSPKTDQAMRLFKNPRQNGTSAKTIALLQSKEELSFANNKLTYLRADIWIYLTNLKALDLSRNLLNTLPSALSILSHLENLNLSQNQLTKAPEVILSLTALRMLNLADNSLTELPGLDVLTHLEVLNVSSNKLCSLPTSLQSLQQLRTLDLSFNGFKVLPRCLQDGLVNLERLDVSGNIRLSLAGPVKSYKLKIFIAKEIPYCPRFPKWLLSGRFSLFEEINFRQTKFEKFFVPSVNQKTMIKRLNLQNCALSSQRLGRILDNVAGLQSLEIGNDYCRKQYNDFNQWPLDRVRAPQALEELEVRCCYVIMMPGSIENFRSLRKVDFGNNDLSWLPSEFCSLKQLQVLILEFNSLNELPEGLGGLRSLRELRVAGNHLGNLPESIWEIPGLKYLDLYHNEFSEVPEKIAECGTLVGFDFEQNWISSEELKIPQQTYENLRDKMRDSDSPYRCYGPRATEPSRTPSPRSSQSDSDGSGFDRLTLSEQQNVADPVTLENWDESEDSSDEFDPNHRKPPRVKTTFTYLDHLKPRFCPADDLPLPMAQKIAIAIAKGEYQRCPSPVAGQFDDIDD